MGILNKGISIRFYYTEKKQKVYRKTYEVKGKEK